MAQTDTDEKRVVYQFRTDADAWKAWKKTVPREKSLETRINELIRADTDGRVSDPDAANGEQTEGG